MRCVDQCWVGETYPKLRQYLVLLAALVVIRGQRVPVPREGRLPAPSVNTTMPGYHFLHKTPRMLAGECEGVPDKTFQALHK
jgi:hypothetical protein